MAEKQGYIKLYRKIQNHWLWKDKPFSRGQAWIDLILLANHKGSSTVIDGAKIEISAGSFVTSLRKLGDRWGWSYTKVDRFLKLLENEKMLLQNRDTKKTVLYLENYALFQESERKTQHRKITEMTQT